jgi:hypothetical protein
MIFRRFSAAQGLGQVRSRFYSFTKLSSPASTGVLTAALLLTVGVAHAAEVPASVPVDLQIELDSLEKPDKKKKKRRGGGVKPLPNPGKFDDYQKECKEALTADVFQGARVEVNFIPVQRVDKQMGVMMVCHFDANAPGGKLVEVGTQMYTEKQILIGRMDDQMRVMGRFHHNISPAVSFRSMFQSQSGGQDFNLMLDLDCKGKDSFWHGKFSAGPQGKVVTVSHQKSVTQAMSVGAEIMHQIGAGTHVSTVIRHRRETDQGKQAQVWTGMLGTMNMGMVSYTHQLCPQILLSSEATLALTPEGVQTSVNAGALYKYQTFKFQSNLKSDLVLQMALESQVMEGVHLSFCSEVNHWDGGSAWGLGFRLG